MQGTDNEAKDDAYGQRNDPQPRIAKLHAHDPDQEFGLGNAHDHADHAFDRAHRQIDVAHDDNQHHAGRHDGDRRRLYREVPQITRREEQTARQKV